MTIKRIHVMLAWIEMIGEATNNPFVLSEFKQRVLPTFADAERLQQTISQAEYESAVAAFRRDLPQILVELKTMTLGAPPYLPSRN